jgi:hypothetical protein
MPRVLSLARTADVELMTHPIRTPEFDYVMGDEFAAALRTVRLGSYEAVG